MTPESRPTPRSFTAAFIIGLEQLGRDFRYASRQLIKSPGFTATVVVTLGLAIGACTVVFTAINSILLHPLAGEKVDRDVILHETMPPRFPQRQLSPPTFFDVERLTNSFETLGAWSSHIVHLEGDTEPLQVRAAALTPGMFTLWGMYIGMGRSFTEEEYANREDVVIIGHSLWQREFGGDPSILTRAIRIDGTLFTVVGVLSPQFERYGSDLDLWVPRVFSDRQRTEQRGNRILQTTGRLKPSVTIAEAQAELDVLAANLAWEYPATNHGWGLLVRDLGVYVNRDLAPMLNILLWAVACVLLIACANVANLLLARATARQREISIRAALGAGRGHLVRQLLVESIILAALGGAVGISLATWSLGFVRIYGPAAGTDLGRLAYIQIDAGVLGFTAGFSVLTAIFFGLTPAWLSACDDLKQGSRGVSEDRARRGLRSMLVVAEVSLAVVLLAGAGLAVRSFLRLTQVDVGFNPENVAMVEVNLNARKYATREQRTGFSNALMEQVSGLPGVAHAALSTRSPFMPNPTLVRFMIEGHSSDAVQPSAIVTSATPEYFSALGVHLLRGRGFDDRDGVAGPAVILINETLAKQYFPDVDPLGQRLTVYFGANPGPGGEIVGVIKDVMQGAVGTPPPPHLYLPWATTNANRCFLIARTSGDPAAVLPLLKSRIFAVDKDQPAGAARTLKKALADALARSHLMVILLGIFGMIAMLIAAVGVYGVMAYTVSQRTMEFGIRMALGASRVNILRSVLWKGMLLVGLGLALGLGASLLLGQVVQALLYDMSPRDPGTLVIIAGLMLAVAFLACLIPARRATRVDPAIALRTE